MRALLLLAPLLALVGIYCGTVQAKDPEPTLRYQIRYYGVKEGEPVYERPAPTPAPVVVAASPTLYDFIARYDWPYWQAVNIVQCESGGRNVQNAQGGPYIGPFQIWTGNFRAGENPWDIETNVAVAYRIWLRSGWSEWECPPW